MPDRAVGSLTLTAPNAIGFDRSSYSSNLAAPTFDDIANVPGMTSRALIVALRTSHRSMPNLVIKGRDAEDLVAYILSLKRN
jgi:hypothetical protein